MYIMLCIVMSLKTQQITFYLYLVRQWKPQKTLLALVLPVVRHYSLFVAELQID